MTTRLLHVTTTLTVCSHSGAKASVWVDIYGYQVEGIAQTNQQMDEWLANNKPSWVRNWLPVM